MLRGLDHVVHVVKDLDMAAKAYEELGFTVTPTAHHAWGTSNRLVQLDGFFIEILCIRDETLIAEHSETAFSFGAHNRDFVKTREGASMLVLDSQSPETDKTEFIKLGLETYDPFSFEREATFGDGSKGRVGFDLTFTGTPLAQDLGFFTCHNRYPDVFWRGEFQSHPNGASAIREVIMVAGDPSDLHEFLGGFSGQREMRATSLGLEIKTARGMISVLSPAAYQALYGDEPSEALCGKLPIIAGLVIEGPSKATQTISGVQIAFAGS